MIEPRVEARRHANIFLGFPRHNTMSQAKVANQSLAQCAWAKIGRPTQLIAPFLTDAWANVPISLWALNSPPDDAIDSLT